MPPLDYDACDATDLANLVRTKKASPRELCEAAIQRIERVNGQLNAVVLPFFEQGLAAADGPLPAGPFKGVPFLLKNLGAFAKDTPLDFGTRYAQGFICPE